MREQSVSDGFLLLSTNYQATKQSSLLSPTLKENVAFSNLSKDYKLFGEKTREIKCFPSNKTNL